MSRCCACNGRAAAAAATPAVIRRAPATVSIVARCAAAAAAHNQRVRACVALSRSLSKAADFALANCEPKAAAAF